MTWSSAHPSKSGNTNSALTSFFNIAQIEKNSKNFLRSFILTVAGNASSYMPTKPWGKAEALSLCTAPDNRPSWMVRRYVGSVCFRLVGTEGVFDVYGPLDVEGAVETIDFLKTGIAKENLIQGVLLQQHFDAFRIVN